MTSLSDLLARFPRVGRIETILLRPARRADPVMVTQAAVGERGLLGDHASGGKRALTLVQAEHLPVISALVGREATPSLLRRNLVVSGLNLSALRGARLRVGAAEVEITGPCAPCSRMEEALGQGGYNAIRGHGGWCARVLLAGELAVGDAVTVLAPPAKLSA
jgi:MOSC domain-containing protein YiiM